MQVGKVEGTGSMKSSVVKRSIVINGHKTSISLEDAFLTEVKAIAAERKLSLSELVSMIDHDRGNVGNLSSALRLLVLARYCPATTAGPQQQVPYRQPQPATP
jgi:predicted DNA-binding ribbon-helix-helix protein